MSDRADVVMEMRAMDAWLRRMAILGPISAFILGWGSGFMTAALLYRDHEKRLNKMEAWCVEHDRIRSEIIGRIQDRLLDLEIKTGLKKPK